MSLNLNHAGLYVSNTKLQLVEVNYRDDKFILENVDEEYFDDFFKPSDKETKIITILQNAYNELVIRKPLKSNLVSFSLPSTFFKVLDIPYDDTLIKNDFEEHLHWEVSVLYPHLPKNETSIQHIKIDKSFLRSGKSLIVLTISKNILRLINKFCQRNNLILKVVDNEHLASNVVIYLDNFNKLEGLYLSIFLRENYFSLVLIERGIPIFFRIKKFRSPEKLANYIYDELEYLASISEETLDIKKTYIFGEAVSNAMIEQLTIQCKINPIKANPFKRIHIDQSIINNSYYTTHFNSFAPAAGLAFRAV